MHDKTHINAATILCGLSTLVLHHFGVEIMNIILIFGIFMIITIYGDMRQWKPYINKAPKIAELSMHMLIGPMMLCVVLSVLLCLAVLFLMLLWLPLVEPMIDSMKEVMEQIATGNIEKEVAYGMLYLFVVVIAAQQFRIVRYWLTGRR